MIDETSTQNGGPPSLADGRYRLRVKAANVVGTDGALLGGNDPTTGDYVTDDDTAGSGAGYHFGLYRLFGDGTGNAVVDLFDLAEFRTTYNESAGSLAYLWYYDADNNGTVDLVDLAEFRRRMNINLFG